MTIQSSLPKSEDYLNVIKKLVLAQESHKSEFEDVRTLNDIDGKIQELDWIPLGGSLRC